MTEFGIIVFGHRRRLHLQNVLESLARQDALSNTHVWIDGWSHSAELKLLVEECHALKADYPEAQWQFHNGRLGIEKLMIDGLSFMSRKYQKIIVLEDDCFPTHNAVCEFLQRLSDIDDNPSIFSVYGHPFGTLNEGAQFTRFQGWGWASTRKKIIPVLSQLKAMFMMSEAEYLSWVDSVLTPEIISYLDVTPGRDVIKVLKSQFSWDSATALLTAILRMSHCKTSERVIYNCGLGKNSGHFLSDEAHLRQPPFNMIAKDEVWQYFSHPLASKFVGLKYFGLDELDRKIEEFIPQDFGIFVEVGAYDGLEQSNTLYFERKGWQGVLIEPIPNAVEKCRENRPLSRVVHAACVGSNFPDAEIEIVDVGLMSLVGGSRRSEYDELAWIKRAEELQQLSSKKLVVPAKTLSSILEEENIREIDLLSVDVEGYEMEVFAGLDFERFRPKHIIVEDSGTTDLQSALEEKGYQLVTILNERKFTRDLLFKCAEKGGA